MRPVLSVLLIAALAACTGDLPTGPAAGSGRLAFVTNRNAGQWDIYVMNPNGSGVAQLDPSLASDLWPSWSPDGKRIVYQSDRTVKPGPPDTVITGIDTTITPRSVAFYNLYGINADGTGFQRLAADTTNDIQPAWSPDGTKIAFSTDRVAGDYEVYVMQADGTNPVRLTNSPGEDGQPAWSPDGSKLAFATTRDAPLDSLHPEIYVMSAVDGSGPVNLTRNTAADIEPAWSPDGAKIAFASDRSGQFEIWVMNANGTSPARLTHGSAPAEFPAWSPDGTKIAYDSDGHIWIMYADGSQPTQVTSKLYSDVIPRWRPTP